MSNKLREDKETLNKYFQEVSTLILDRQNPATGLIPASVAITSHGDYRDAWVRDNVYSILAVWGLALAYRRLDDDEGRAYELEHATIKCMRGLLFAMMRQSSKVEQFKNSQAIEHALHAKYNTATGSTVVGDREWGHLQIDATSIFLLMLAQMTSSGLHIIYTIDEVHFVQNLVFYIERAYRTPDYGIWERGNKMNHGQPELNCSSIGMVVAALQAINGINLFGSRGGASSVIHVLPDEITRNATTLHSALPRESASKEIDAALLAVISFPAFAVADKALAKRTRIEIVKKLGGRYGCKRFLRDGHQTVLEDSSRLHYEPHELKIFEGAESEWPLFFTYLILDGLFRNDYEQVEHYRRMLEPLLVDSSRVPQFSREHQFELSRDIPENLHTRKISFSKNLPPERMKLVPELYIVPRELIEAERANHGSQERVPNQNVPLVWAQSLYILGNLIYDNLLSAAELDPLGRRLMPFDRSGMDSVVQIALLAETPELQAKLRMYGLETQTVENCAPITISQPSALRDAFQVLGENKKLGLSGRPKRPMGTLSTCKIYRCQGKLYAFLPHFMDREEFYLVSDNDYLVSLFEQELAFIRSHWFSNGRPTMIVMLTNQMLEGVGRSHSHPDTRKRVYNVSDSKRNLYNFMMSLRSAGVCNGVRVRVGRLSEMINTSCIESLDFLVDKQSSVSEDWERVLRGEESYKPDTPVTHLNKSDESYDTPTACKLRKNSLISDVPRAKDGGTLLYPVSPPPSGEEPEDYKLLAHRDNEPSKLEIGIPKDSQARPLSPARVHLRKSFDGSDGAKNINGGGLNISINSTKLGDSSPKLLALTLGDPSNIDQAISLLFSSANLYDQIDILHYIYSCKGFDYVVDGLCKVEVLVEEVYAKAMHLKQWSLVRQAAGLLKKTVNSLTSNLSDLLVRQKPVTIGFGPQEYFIDSPKNPAALAEIIFSHCASDIREAPLIQEIITYLGSFIRGSPQMFEGIMRIRTHFFVIAMREEISQTKRCNEEEAVELLMQLSPFEMKSLMSQILTARDQVDLHRDSNLINWKIRHSNLKSDQKILDSETSISYANFPNTIKIIAQSGGYQAGNFAKIQIIRDGIEVPVPGIFGRGLNLALIDPVDGSIIETAHYDTNVSRDEAEAFAKKVEWLEPGTIAVVVAKDDCSEHLVESGKLACEKLGASKIRQVLYRDSWCLIGEMGADSGSVAEFHRPAHLGPTEQIEFTIDLLARRTNLVAESNSPDVGQQSTATPINSILPSNGRWIRRRKNDGALNRVPPQFYPKVWKLLSNSQGINIGKAFLPRDPTISEKTPEELNFALQVEAIFDHIRDPAERQIAVECIVVISKLSDRNPELKLSGGKIELLKIIRSAVDIFWDKWLNKQGLSNNDQLSTSHHNTPHGFITISTTESNHVPGTGASSSAASTATTISAVSAKTSSSCNVNSGGNNGRIEEINEQRRFLAETSKVSIASSLLANLEHDNSASTPATGALSPTSSFSPGLSFKKNERLARRLFFDLPQDGDEGTMFYLATACMQSIFTISWSEEATIDK